MTGPKYPNQQLGAVSLETFFPGSLRAVNRFELVQDAFAQDFPNLFVPKVEDGEPIAMRPLQLTSADRGKVIALAVNQATFVEREYGGHETFLDEAVSTLERVLSLVELKRLNRVVYRYDNAISLGREDDGLYPVHRVFSLGSPLFGNAGVANFDLTWCQPSANGRLHVDMLLEQQRGPNAVLRASIAAEVPCSGPSELRERAEQAHADAVEMFESTITNQFRDLIQGGD